MENSGRKYLQTERAHYQCPNMHFGILARIRENYDENRVRETVSVLQKAHPFLKSLIAEEPGSGKLYYREQEVLEIPILKKSEPETWQRDYDALALQGWNAQRESMLRLLVYPGTDGFAILMTAHHLLCDGRGLLQLVNEFAEHYVRGTDPRFAEEKLIASLDDLPAKSDLPFVSRVVIGDANRRWDREQRRVSYGDYLAFEKKFIRENPVRRETITVGSGELEAIRRRCRQHGISVNDWLIAKMMLEEDTEKIVMAADIRDRIGCYQPGAMGNYSTAFSVTARKRGKDLFTLARQVASGVAAVRGQPQREMLVLACYLRMRPELLDAAAISALGGFESEAAAFVGGRMFGYASRSGHCVTNLGRVESELISEAVFIPPASPANSLTWGVLTVNGQMKICAAASEQTAN